MRMRWTSDPDMPGGGVFPGLLPGAEPLRPNVGSEAFSRASGSTHFSIVCFA